MVYFVIIGIKEFIKVIKGHIFIDKVGASEISFRPTSCSSMGNGMKKGIRCLITYDTSGALYG